MKGMSFIPLKLPLDKSIIVYQDFINEFTRAQTKLGALNEKLNVEHFHTHAINHLLKLESLYSTKIEGTQTTIDSVYEAEVDSKINDDDINEVLRYNKAITEGSLHVKNGELITNKLIKEIHEILLGGNIRKNSPFIAGEFRFQQNRVGDHIPPIASDVENYMGNLEKYINSDYGYEDDLPHIIKIAIIHAQFETIHPFPDGNGRVGRILIPLYLYKEKVIKHPYFFLSQELERQKNKYYSYLQGTRTNDAHGYSEWFKYFFNAIANQAEKDIQFVNNLDALYNETFEKIKMIINSSNVTVLIQAMFKQPTFTTEYLHQDTKIEKNTIRGYLNKLVENRIIFKGSQKRNVKYYFYDLLEIIK